LAGIVRHIARDNPAAADRTAYKLIEKAESLQVLPHRGRLVPERAERDWRELILRPYRIVYRVDEERQLVHILRFWHGARNAPVIYEPVDE